MTRHDPYDTRKQDEQRDVKDRADRLAYEQSVEDVKWLMSSKRGRRFMWRLLTTTGVFKTSFTGNSETFFLEGQRNVGLIHLAMVQDHCQEQYLAMLSERSNGN